MAALAATSVSDPDALDVVADLSDPSDRHDKALPAVHFPEVDTSNLCHDSDSDVDLQFGELPSQPRQGQLAARQQHANYARGMRVAELATQWITGGPHPRTFRSF